MRKGMKIAKGISLFLIYPAALLGIGFLGGMSFITYFYPGRVGSQIENVHDASLAGQDWQNAALENLSGGQDPNHVGDEGSGLDGIGSGRGPADGAGSDINEISGSQGAGALGGDHDLYGDLGEDLAPVSLTAEKLTADTEYVLEETDVRNQTVVETTWKVPAKYIGMNREEFLKAMEEYEAFPPLSELERGFVSLEVLSFSTEKVVVQMNYEYTQPSSSFYLVVENNYVVVYLDDRETIYMYTDILLSELPDTVQQDVINVMFVEDEESLYDFLESYSS